MAVHYTRLLKDFIDGSAGGFARVELRRLGLVDSRETGPKGPIWRLTRLGEERARRLGYLKDEANSGPRK